MLEINQEHNKQAQELFNKHREELTECLITNVQMEIESIPIELNDVMQYSRTEKRIFTYEGYTKSCKKITLTIED